MPLIQYMARIQFDYGARRLLDEELLGLGVRRPLIVADAGIAANGVLDMALEDMRTAAMRYDGVLPNPTLEGVRHALEMYNEFDCDGVVAVGGGSAIDTGKAVALLATHDGPLANFRVDTGGSAQISARIAPIVAIPTTAGTGSEIGRGMGIALDDGPKAAFISLHLIPKVAICDPDLTLSLPPRLTAGTGIDAFSHCFEPYLSPVLNPPADAVALDGIERLARYLPRAVEVGNDREARWNVMMGAIEGAMCMWKGLGPAHALSIPLDALGLHHGTLVGVLLPHAWEFVKQRVPDDRAARLKNALGNVPDIGLALEAMNRAIGLPPDLAAMGVTEDVLPAAAGEAAQSFFSQTSARHGSDSEYLELAQRALHAHAIAKTN